MSLPRSWFEDLQEEMCERALVSVPIVRRGVVM